MPGREYLGHGRHPREVTPEHADHPDLCRRLEGRAEPRRVDALGQRLPDPRGCRVCERAKFGVVGGAHVREARPQRVVVRPDERRGSLQVQVVRDEHELSRLQILANPSAGVRDDERACSEPRQNAHAERRRVRRDAPRRDERAPSSPPPARPRTCRARGCRRGRAPSTPASPGISPYGISTASSTRSAKPPRPEPSTTAARGTSGVRSRIAATAPSIVASPIMPSPRRRARRSGRRRSRRPRRACR